MNGRLADSLIDEVVVIESQREAGSQFQKPFEELWCCHVRTDVSFDGKNFAPFPNTMRVLWHCVSD